MQQVLDRAVYVRHGQCRSGCATDWKSGDAKAESTGPRSPGEIVQLFLQHAVGGVWIDSHFERDLSFLIRVTNRVLHPIPVASSSLANVPDRLLGAAQEFHDSFGNIGNRLCRISGDVLRRVKRTLGRS